MNRIVVFGGTTEGRRLSDMLSEHMIEHTVAVASEYGKAELAPSAYRTVCVGRMDSDGMRAFFEKKAFTRGDMIVDATHPYAELVTVNLTSVSETMGLTYIRIIREDISETRESFTRYDDMSACAAAVDATCGNILLTTGSKDIGEYASRVSQETIERTYARVLPTVESIDACVEAGIDPRHIIAMHGPFDTRMNVAIIDQFNIKHLITKASGAAGGFEEKLTACIERGISCHVISRPIKEQGVSIYEAYHMIAGEEYRTRDKREIYLIGYGMGGRKCLTIEADAAIREADAVFGSKRLTDGISAKRKYPLYMAEDIIAALEREPDIRRAAVVFSGDSGFYSGAGRLREALIKWSEDTKIHMLAGISSVSYMASRMGISYEDAVIRSIHGRNDDSSMRSLIEDISYNGYVFILLSGDKDLRDVAKRLYARGADCVLYVGRNLSYEDESVICLTVKEAMEYSGDGILTVLVINKDHDRRPLINVTNDEDFIRDKVPMTKECVRNEVLIRLGIREGDVVYDIGGGTGSVAVSAAYLHPSVRVYCVEKEPEAIRLINQNKLRLNASNVTVIEAAAPDIPKDINAPDCVFIGGSGGRLRDIIDEIHTRKSGARYVITSVSMETSAAVTDIIKEYEIADARITQLQVSDAVGVGCCHMLRAQNPVTIFSFTY